MILVTIGTQKFEFNRLLEKIDELVERNVITDVIAQIGYSSYKPANYTYYSMMDAKDMDDLVEKSDLIITHSGTSSIIKALKKHKRVLVVPRQKKYKEHVDDHQLEIAEMFEKKKLVEVVYEIEDLEHKVSIVLQNSYARYENTNKELQIDIKQYISGILDS